MSAEKMLRPAPTFKVVEGAELRFSLELEPEEEPRPGGRGSLRRIRPRPSGVRCDLRSEMTLG